eukprot:10504892-Alexandrium_andersonii.AAC.1
MTTITHERAVHHPKRYRHAGQGKAARLQAVSQLCHYGRLARRAWMATLNGDSYSIFSQLPPNIGQATPNGQQ